MEGRLDKTDPTKAQQSSSFVTLYASSNLLGPQSSPLETGIDTFLSRILL